MPDWQAELTAILQAQDVRLERDLPATSEGMDGASHSADEADSSEAGMLHSGHRGEQVATEDDESSEVSAVRHEIEATLARVVHLSRAGQLDPALRDDVVFVLQALTRPRPAPPATTDPDEWQLASAAAVLHFCRVVHRLTGPLEPGAPG